MDESSDNSDDPANLSYKPPGISSPTSFYTKRPKRITRMTRIKILPIRKSAFNRSTNNDKTTHNTSTLQISTLPYYSTVNSNPNDYPIKTPTDDNDSESPVKVNSKTNYPFPPP